MSFDTPPPPPPTTNVAYDVRIIHSRASCLVKGLDAERKVIGALSKNQYHRFIKNESSLKDVQKLEESRDLD